jgi:hypothetical protein
MRMPDFDIKILGASVREHTMNPEIANETVKLYSRMYIRFTQERIYIHREENVHCSRMASCEYALVRESTTTLQEPQLAFGSFVHSSLIALRSRSPKKSA